VNLSLLLDMAVDGFGDRFALGRKRETYTAADVSALSAAGAAALKAGGATALGHLDVNGPCFTIALFAAARAGIPRSSAIPERLTAQP
jgi:hypothetical protein